MLRHFIFMLGLSIAAAACDRAATDGAVDAPSALNDQMPATDTGGTPAADPQTPADQTPAADTANAGETPAATGDRDLPGTASALPLAGLVALLSLGGAAALRAWRG